MVRTENSIAYAMMELYRATNKVTDSLDIRIFKNWVQNSRATIAKQRLDSNKTIDENLVQDLGAVEMVPVDSSIYTTVSSDKYMLRSVKDIPFTINRNNHIGTFTRIGPADRLDIKYNLVSYDRALYSGNGRFNNNDIYTFLDGNKLCLISKTNLHKLVKQIHVKGVFVNPQEAYEFRYGVGTWTSEQVYPISEAVILDMETLITDKKFKFILAQMEDKISDGTDNTTTTKIR